MESDSEMATHYEQIGGELALRAIIDDFVHRCFADAMIGFMFRAASEPDRVAEFEFQHASAHLGGPHRYAGRSIRQIHAAHRIMGGQFMRRLQILKETLTAHGVPTEVREHWIAVHESLRPEVTGDPGSQCR